MQDAVDAVDAAGEEVLVASGTYTGVNYRGAVTQTLYISKSVTVRGGYTTTNWDDADPEANPTTLDAQGQGRVVYVTGSAPRLWRGCALPGGMPLAWAALAAGCMSIPLQSTISHCVIISNTANRISGGDGGGLYLNTSHNVKLTGSTVQSNTASLSSTGFGGGLYLWKSNNLTVSGNVIRDNVASITMSGYGGGFWLYLSAGSVLSDNTISGNMASVQGSGWGGGLYSSVSSGATLSGNTVVSNTASTGGTGEGGGLYFLSGVIDLINNVVAGNEANSAGSGLWFGGSSGSPATGEIVHNTIADNHSSGQGVYLGNYGTFVFTNTILAGHDSVGIFVDTGGNATLEATLWYDNGADTGGSGTVATGTVDLHGDPAFVDPSAWDYHIEATSAALDAGVDADVTTDIDGDPRPMGYDYDIGADEFDVGCNWLLTEATLRCPGNW